MSKVTAASVRGSAWPERLGHLPGGSWGFGWVGRDSVCTKREPLVPRVERQ